MPVEQNLGAALAIGECHHVMNKGALCVSGAELQGNETALRNYLSV